MLVRLLAFYSKNLNSNPAEVYNFSVKLLLKRTERNKKRPRLAHFWKYEEKIISWSSHVGGFVDFLEARFSKSKIIREFYRGLPVWPDVTRSFPTFGQLHQLELLPNGIQKFAKVCPKFSQVGNKPSKNCRRLWIIGQNGEWSHWGPPTSIRGKIVLPHSLPLFHYFLFFNKVVSRIKLVILAADLNECYQMLK